MVIGKYAGAGFHDPGVGRQCSEGGRDVLINSCVHPHPRARAGPGRGARDRRVRHRQSAPQAQCAEAGDDFEQGVLTE